MKTRMNRIFMLAKETPFRMAKPARSKKAPRVSHFPVACIRE